MPENIGTLLVLRRNQFLALFEYRHASRSSASDQETFVVYFCESDTEERRKECKARARMTTAIPVN